MSEKIYKVYILLFPKGEVYIGKTHRDIKVRWRNGNGYPDIMTVRSAIDKYGWENIEKKILYENLTKEEAARLEQEEIAKHGGINHPLVLNEQSGGDKGFHLSESTKSKMRETAKQMYKNYPELWDPAREARMVKVDQYSYDYSTLIASYNSIAEAVNVLGLNSNHISDCLSGKRLECGGYRWIQHGKHFGIKQFRPMIKVDQLDKETEKIICSYESIDAAARATGAGHSHIADCMNGIRKTAGGYKWRKSVI